jgi:hypothetical protein
MNITSLLCAGSLLVLSGCAYEAGSQIDEGGFGNPTMNNMLAHMASRCAGQAKGYIVPDPVVVRDPADTSDVPRYRLARVQCLGGLDGKYAQVIYGEYVASATEATSVEEVSLEGSE